MILKDERVDQTTRIQSALNRITSELLNELHPEGYWLGELSSSALSTAVATIALGKINPKDNADFIFRGLRWLAENANDDGGWGDTIRSKSNISTTALCWAAFGANAADAQYASTVQRAEAWLARSAGSLAQLPEAIGRRYGKDRTFSVPILMTLAISGRSPTGWQNIPSLPFELAVVPRKLYGALSLPVVSYALPALVAIGQAIHHHAPSRNPLLRGLRNSSRGRTLALLEQLQPPNGGFLEATPLTAFVTMSLASAGRQLHPVAQQGAAFLRSARRADGSWPIDTNLATWVTTLSIKALSAQPNVLSDAQKERTRHWLLNQQTKTIHPYTGAAPGAWAWTDLPGGVPDADDTSGALLALYHLGPADRATIRCAENGITWLLNLQNRDGGIPTFCRGWGALPFDRSTPEITAHALRAWNVWEPRVNRELAQRIGQSSRRALRFLSGSQRCDGAFIPLWFGNEHAPDENNPVYGTAQVLIALNSLVPRYSQESTSLRKSAADFLIRARNASGRWGGDTSAPESLEETALASEALSGYPDQFGIAAEAADRLVCWLELQLTHEPSPIGLYFARLWYYERLYPLIFAVSALGSFRSQQF